MPATYGESDAELRTTLTNASHVAVVGLSPNPHRPSHQIAAYLIQHGYSVSGVNPVIAGQTVLGRPVYASLVQLPDPPDIIDIFRRSEFVAGIVDEAVALRAGIRESRQMLETATARRDALWVIWTQFGIVDDVAAARARAAGFTVVQDQCIRVEIARLGVRPVGDTRGGQG